MSDIKIEMVENDFAEATKELHPKKDKNEKNKIKKKKQQQTWSDGFLASLGCGERVIKICIFNFFKNIFN